MVFEKKNVLVLYCLTVWKAILPGHASDNLVRTACKVLWATLAWSYIPVYHLIIDSAITTKSSPTEIRTFPHSSLGNLVQDPKRMWKEFSFPHFLTIQSIGSTNKDMHTHAVQLRVYYITCKESYTAKSKRASINADYHLAQKQNSSSFYKFSIWG